MRLSTIAPTALALLALGRPVAADPSHARVDHVLRAYLDSPTEAHVLVDDGGTMRWRRFVTAGGARVTVVTDGASGDEWVDLAPAPDTFATPAPTDRDARRWAGVTVHVGGPGDVSPGRPALYSGSPAGRVPR